MRIFHLIWDLSGGGAERQLCYLATELACMGHEVHIAYCNEGLHRLELPGVILHQLKARSSYDLTLLWQVFRLVKRIKPDILHTWLMQMDIIGAIASLFVDIPQVCRESSSGMAYNSGLKIRMRQWAVSRSKAIVSNSLGGDEYWANHLPMSRRYIVANGLPIDQINATRTAVPHALVSVDTPIVLYIGRLIPSKNLRNFIEVLERVNQNQRIFGIICGEGHSRSELELLISNRGMGGYVHFTGFLPASSVWALMKKASVFVSLSDYEGCPNTVMEAMACGCPVVLSDIPAHREIADENCAVLVDAMNIAQIVNSLSRILRDVGSTNARALIAKERANQWSINKMTRNYQKIYMELLEVYKA